VNSSPKTLQEGKFEQGEKIREPMGKIEKGPPGENTPLCGTPKPQKAL